MNIGALIKKFCDLTYIHLLQKPNTNDQREDVKVLKFLVESQWANEISAKATSNLNKKKCDSPNFGSKESGHIFTRHRRRYK